VGARTPANLEIVSIGPGLHFVQEDHPHEIGAQLAAWVRRRSGERRRHNKGREPFMTSSDMTSPILITGAIGRHGVRVLISYDDCAKRAARPGAGASMDERTEPLQALGAEIVVGDLHDRASLVPALEGVGSAYFTYPVNGGIVQAAANFAAAAGRSEDGRESS